MTNRYDSSTRYLFVNTEAYENQGDQINNIRLNMAGNSFESDDDSLIKLSLTQFNMPKNFYNINDTNNTFRVILSGFTHASSGVIMDDIDTLLKLDVADYLTHVQLQQNFAEKLKVILDAKVNGSGTACTFAVTPIADKTDTFGVKFGSSCELKPQASNQLNKNLVGVTVTASVSSFRFDNVFHIHSLHIPPGEGNQTLGFSGSTLTADEQFNDSAILFGGNRTKIFVDPESDSESLMASENCFSITTSSQVASILGYYPMNTALNTLPYVYLRINTALNQCTSNFENVSHSHKSDIVPTHILAKIERRILNDGSVFYRSNDEVVYNNFITQNRLSDLQISVTDDKGRVVPQNNLGNNMGHFTQAYTTTSKDINRNGNLFCDFTLKLERIAIPFQPNTLQGFPDPVRGTVKAIHSNIPMKSSCL